MNDAGFEYQATPASSGITSSDLSREYFETHGFGITNPIVETVSGPNFDYVRSLDPHIQNDFYSTEGSCMDRASDQLVEVRTRSWGEIGLETQGEIQGLLFRTHPSLTALDPEWSACMTESGFDFDSPLDLVAQLEAGVPDRSDVDAIEDFATLERSAAVAYYDCFDPIGSQLFWSLVREADQKVVSLLGSDGILK